MSPREIVGQCVGAVAMALIFASYQQKQRKRLLILQIFSGLLFTAHFLLLGAYTGAGMNALGVLRCVVYANSDKKWASSPVWLALFIAAFAAAGAFTWQSALSLLPIAAMITSTVGLWLKKERLLRLVTLPSSPMWMIYNIFQHSIAGVITEVFVTTSMIIAIIRYDLRGGAAKPTAAST